MSDVVSRVLHALDWPLRRAGASLDDLLTKHGLSPTHIRRRPNDRIAWDRFADVLEDAGARLGGSAALEQVGASELLRVWPKLADLISRLVTPYIAFQIGVQCFGPAIFRGIRGCVRQAPGGLEETVTIPSDRRDSPEFFWLCGGVIRNAPMLLGWETTAFEMVTSERRATYRLSLEDPRKRRKDSETRGFRSEEESDELDILGLELARDDMSASDAEAEHALVAERAREILREHDMAAVLSAADMAKRLAMSERSLARHLAAEGVSFRTIRDEVGRELAVDRIRRGESISNVAYGLGFSEVAAFHRAFRRWTGDSPGRFKRPVA